jgi:hypothetical protein
VLQAAADQQQVQLDVARAQAVQRERPRVQKRPQNVARRRRA